MIGGYKDVFKNPTTKKYKDGTNFEDIVELYYFDEQLRQMIADGSQYADGATFTALIN